MNEKQHKQQIRYSLQTNGLLLDEAWALFLKQHDVLTGISLDGYESLHEHMRKMRKGKRRIGVYCVRMNYYKGMV